MLNLPKHLGKEADKDVDHVAVAVDWLDACRRHDLGLLLDLYAPDAMLECECDGGSIYAGRAALETYWRPRLKAFAPDAFGLEAIGPASDGVVLDYLNCEGKPVRIVFTFDAAGKILQTRCGPLAPALDAVSVQDRA
ncbi:MAG: nuclear transport factor 2 family protein [Bradyrhizobium sp.]|nr:nuclear transport factor 2 family protein [Bradyrhizobium sp.]